MPNTELIRILSDVHYAGPAEQARVDFELVGIPNPLVRLFVRFWRRYVWLRNPFAHNYLLDRFVETKDEPDLVVANGDYSCDSAFIGLADPASRESAELCLQKLQNRFGARLHTVMGDHELGKSSLAGNQGGLRLESWQVSTGELNIPPAWERRVHNHVLIGVTSTLIALEAFERDILPEELSAWQNLRETHLQQVRQIFANVRPAEKIVLFCHDPTALPYLAKETFVTSKLLQLERTVIGHLHTPLVFLQARVLAGFPPIHFLGKGIRRISRGLNRARSWRPFRVLLCPSLPGSQLLKDGGYYDLQLSENAPARFIRHRLRWEKQNS